ncbi:E3 ubiquitin ligase complex SCF subunit scon-3 [Halotydeus destructor]|nr:E3 ubiquitin ligase complex SCF subunit scon-3 [Halotydeus destructor]
MVTVELITADSEKVFADISVVRYIEDVQCSLADMEDNKDGDGKLKKVKRDAIRLTSVTGSVLKEIIKWLEHYAQVVEEHSTDESISEWDKNYVHELDREMLFSVTNAAWRLKLTRLHDICCHSIAEHINGKPLEEVRQFLNIMSDFSVEEEHRLIEQHAWAHRI